MNKNTTDFSQGPVWQAIARQSVPLFLAQLVQLLYNVVDRIYIGHLPGANSLALTGVGLIFPLTMLIAAFTLLFSSGGTPLFSMARGNQDEEHAEHIMGSTFTMLLLTSFVLFLFCYMLRRPILYLFGASDASYVYADQYLRIYLLGTTFTMIATGMNGFINAQGFPRIGMATTMLGAVLNIILDPIFIFVCNMGVAGAALATIISQTVSAIWVMRFLISDKAILRLKRSQLRPDFPLVRRIMSLGMSGFIMQATNCVAQVAYTSTLKIYGGDLYIGILTVLNSVREIMTLAVLSVTNGSQPVLGYNYGAKAYQRVKEGVRITTWICLIYTAIVWVIVFLFPSFFLQIFTNDPEMIENGTTALRIYFFGFLFQSFQFAGQSTFVSLGYSRHAIFFSLLRKAVIVTPLALLLPRLGFGSNGVFMSEPISNIIGGLACFITMYFTVYRKLGVNEAK